MAITTRTTLAHLQDIRCLLMWFDATHRTSQCEWLVSTHPEHCPIIHIQRASVVWAQTDQGWGLYKNWGNVVQYPVDRMTPLELSEIMIRAHSV